jgi:CBS domain-containing protein
MPTPLTVRDMMTSEVVSVLRGTTFKQVAAVLSRHRISAVPVLEADGRVAGVVTVGDLLPKEAYRGQEPSRRQQLLHVEEIGKAAAETAGDLMSAPAVTVGERATLSEAARLMARRRVKQLPVVDPDGHLVGILSRGDLLRAFLQPDETLAENVRQEIGQHLPAVDPDLIDIEVEDGVVTLDGEVADARFVPAVGRLAHTVEGVVAVHNRLRSPAEQPESRTAEDPLDERPAP